MEQLPVARMLLLHRAFRREFGFLPAAVASVEHADVRRATAVSGHIGVLLGWAKEHREREGRLVRPWLRERTGAGPQRWLDLQQSQDQIVDVLTDALVADLGGWAGAADRWTRGRLVRHLHQANALLAEHQEHQERRMLPLMSEHLRAVEWERLLAGMRATPPVATFRPWLIRTGALLEGAAPAEAAWFRAGQSRTARLCWPLVGRLAYTRHTRVIRRRPVPAVP